MHHADVVELVDTLDSGSSACKGMKVQVLSSALKDPVVRYRVFRFLEGFQILRCMQVRDGIFLSFPRRRESPFFAAPDSVPGSAFFYYSARHFYELLLSFSRLKSAKFRTTRE